MLPTPLIQRLLRDGFHQGILAPNRGICVLPTDQKSWFEQLVLRLQDLPRTQSEIQEISDEPPAPQVELSLRVIGISDTMIDSFKLTFQPLEEPPCLCIQRVASRRSKKPEFPVRVCSIEQLEAFISAVQVEQDREHLEAKKAEKLDKFRRQGFVGQLKELSREHQFGFAVGETDRDYQLSLRVGILKWAYHFSFPKTIFHKVLPELPELAGHLWRHIHPRSLTDELFAFHFYNPRSRPPIFVEQFPALIACVDRIQALGVTLLPPNKSISTWVDPPKFESEADEPPL